MAKIYIEPSQSVKDMIDKSVEEIDDIARYITEKYDRSKERVYPAAAAIWLQNKLKHTPTGGI